MDEEPINEKAKDAIKPLSNGFIPELKGKKVIIRLISGGQAVTGSIEAYNPYELLLQTTKGKLVVFKHAIATIETVDEQKGLQADRGGFKADEKTFSAR
jgi:sRNA-binding regulator protein Hfq